MHNRRRMFEYLWWHAADFKVLKLKHTKGNSKEYMFAYLSFYCYDIFNVLFLWLSLIYAGFPGAPVAYFF